MNEGVTPIERLVVGERSVCFTKLSFDVAVCLAVNDEWHRTLPRA
jgi:hypothetical protein